METLALTLLVYSSSKDARLLHSGGCWLLQQHTTRINTTFNCKRALPLLEMESDEWWKSQSMVKHAPLAEEQDEEDRLIRCFYPLCLSLSFSAPPPHISSAGLNILSILDFRVASCACFDPNIGGSEDCCFLNRQTFTDDPRVLCFPLQPAIGGWRRQRTSPLSE